MELTKKSPSRVGSFLHLLTRCIGLTGLLAAGAGLLLCLAADLLTLGQLLDVVQHGGDRLATAAAWTLLGGAAAVLLGLLVEAGVGLAVVTGRRSAFGFNALLQVVLAAVLLVGINLFSFWHYLRFDWTRSQQFTLPESVRQELGRLRDKTTIVVYQRHRTFGQLTDKLDAYDDAAERKVIEKIKDLVDLFRELGPKFQVEVLDVKEEGFDQKLADLTADAPALRAAIEKAPENSIFFYSPREGDKMLPFLAASTVGLVGSPGGQGPFLAASALFPGRTSDKDTEKVQSLSFNEFYQLDKTRSKQDGNLVLLNQGVEPFARRVMNIEEKKPRIGIAVVHEWLTTGGPGDFGLKGLKKSLEGYGFEVRDIVLKKWSLFAPPDAAVYTFEESKLDRIEGRLQIVDLALKARERAQQNGEELQKLWKTASLDELNKKYAKQLQGRKITEAVRQRQLEGFSAELTFVGEELAELRQHRGELEKEKAGLNADELAEQRRMSDLQAKMDRMLADCDLLIIPRMTLRNVADENQNISYRAHRLDDAQVSAVRDFLKAGKPVLVCFGPANDSERRSIPDLAGPDGMDTLLAQLGIKLGKQTILFDAESESFADRQVGFQAASGDVKIPPVEFDWKPGAGRVLGHEEPEDRPPNRLRESLRIIAHSVGTNLNLEIRHPRPVYYEEDRVRQARQALATLACVPEPGVFPGITLAAVTVNSRQEPRPQREAEFMMTSRDSWNEDQPFPTDERVPRYEPPKPDDPTKGTLDEKRRGPFPIAVAVETTVPGEWYDRLTAWPPRVRVAAIGQGGFFTGNELKPPQEKTLLTTLNWLLARDDRLPHDDRPWEYPRVAVDARSQEVWHWATWLGLPAVFFYLGMVVLLVRRMR
jgi:hypothetical protein